MSVDLSELIPSLKREVNQPGENLFPNATDADWLGYLQDAFWYAKLYEFSPFDNYTESVGIVDPITGAVDLERKWQQIIVLFAATTALTTKLLNTTSSFRAKAGPVEFETSQSALLLKGILDAINKRLDEIKEQLSELGASPTYYLDSFCARTTSMGYGDIGWSGGDY